MEEVVGDVARPRAAWPLNGDLGHLPGEQGFVAGARNLAGWLNRGADHLDDLRRRHGNVFRSQFWIHPIVCVFDPELVAKIARNEDRAWSAALAWHFFFDGVDPTSATMDSPVTLDFEPHKDARKLLQPAFSGAAVAGYLETAAPMFARAIDRWVTDGRVTFKPAIRRLLAEVSTRIFIGVDDSREAETLDRALADFWAGPMAMTKNRWLSPKWRRAMQGHRTLRETLRPKVAERRRGEGTDLFSRLCRTEREGEWLDDDGLVRLFIGLLAGAFDTTSLGLASMMYLLARHPEWQDRVREEARAIPSPTAEDVRRLEVTDRAWKETLRLFPVSANLPRVSLRDVDLGGFRIPAGTLVQAMTGPLGRDPAWWTEPRKFDPDRFGADRAEDRKHPGAFVPFGAGAHACIGMHLSNLEAKLFCHALVTKARFRLEDDREAGHVYAPLGSVKGDVGLVIEKIG